MDRCGTDATGWRMATRWRRKVGNENLEKTEGAGTAHWVRCSPGRDSRRAIREELAKWRAEKSREGAVVGFT